MSESDVAAAERLAGKRAVHLLALAATLIGTEVLALEDVQRLSRLFAWMLLVVLAGLNLLPASGGMLSKNLMPFLNDEATQDNRRAAFQTGFWAALVSGLCVAVVSYYEPLSGIVAARVIVTAALAAALIGFALRERQAVA